MNKTVDINERTLEKEKKNFLTFCKVAEAFLSLMCALMIIASIAIAIMMIMNFIMKNSTVPSSNDFSTPEGIFNGIYIIVTCIGFAIALNFGIKVFGTLKDGETPFRYEIADKIKAAGMTLIGTGILHIIGEAVNGFLNSIGVFNGELSVGIVLDFFVLGAIIIAVAYIFNYGCKLQQESDETI
ncbi:MAG: DUF2975 domain-containing protein [Oscillospiraceae bacterium]|nr:DUF2975 domain-containing protein [Oscillospiraceae bacterium]